MRKNTLKVLGVTVLLSCTSLNVSLAQYNPSGLIEEEAWNILFPVLNPFGAAPDVATLNENWVAPHELGDENPDGEEFEGWSDIDFGGASPATGYDYGGIDDGVGPLWYTLPALADAFGDQVSMVDFTDANRSLNFQDNIVNPINSFVIPSFPGGTNWPGDNVVGIATTYVENLEEDMEVEICVGSDDSVQVWLNDTVVITVSASRGWGGGFNNCQNTARVVLPAGISKIVALTWEGGGGHNLGLGIRLPGGTNLTDGNGLIEFLGPGEGSLEGQESYKVERSYCQNGSPLVTLQGNGLGDAAQMVTVVETITAADLDGLEVTDPSHDGEVEAVISSDDGVDRVTGAVLEFFVLGPIANALGANPGAAAIRESYLDDGDDVAELEEGDVVADRDGVEQTVRRIPINNGDGLDFNQVGGGGDNILHYAWTKVTVTEETQLVIGAGSDDSVQVLVDGDEVLIRNRDGGWGGVGTAEESGLATLDPGTHTILTKTFEGGGGHGVRLLLLAAPENVGPGGLDCDEATEIAPGQVGVGTTVGGEVALDCNAQFSPAKYYVTQGTGSRMQAQTCSDHFLYDTFLAVFTDSCEAPVCIIDNDDSCGRQSLVEWDSEADETYYIRVYGWDTRLGAFLLRVSDEDTPAADADLSPLGGPGICVDPVGDCDPEAEFVTARSVTWTVDRGTLADPGVSYTVEGTLPTSHSGVVRDAEGGLVTIIGGVASVIEGGGGECAVDVSVGKEPCDFNDNGRFDLSDPVALLNRLFMGGVPYACGALTAEDSLAVLDSNASGRIDLSDAVHMLTFLFLGGDTPAPIANAGPDGCVQVSLACGDTTCP